MTHNRNPKENKKIESDSKGQSTKSTTKVEKVLNLVRLSKSPDSDEKVLISPKAQKTLGITASPANQPIINESQKRHKHTASGTELGAARFKITTVEVKPAPALNENEVTIESNANKSEKVKPILSKFLTIETAQVGQSTKLPTTPKAATPKNPSTPKRPTHRRVPSIGGLKRRSEIFREPIRPELKRRKSTAADEFKVYPILNKELFYSSTIPFEYSGMTVRIPLFGPGTQKIFEKLLNLAEARFCKENFMFLKTMHQLSCQERVSERDLDQVFVDFITGEKIKRTTEKSVTKTKPRLLDFDKPEFDPINIPSNELENLKKSFTDQFNAIIDVDQASFKANEDKEDKIKKDRKEQKLRKLLGNFKSSVVIIYDLIERDLLLSTKGEKYTPYKKAVNSAMEDYFYAQHYQTFPPSKLFHLAENISKELSAYVKIHSLPINSKEQKEEKHKTLTPEENFDLLLRKGNLNIVELANIFSTLISLSKKQTKHNLPTIYGKIFMYVENLFYNELEALRKIFNQLTTELSNYKLKDVPSKDKILKSWQEFGKVVEMIERLKTHYIESKPVQLVTTTPSPLKKQA